MCREVSGTHLRAGGSRPRGSAPGLPAWMTRPPSRSTAAFSTESTPIFASKYSFFRVFRDLQNCLAKFSKSLQKFAKNQRFSQKSALFFAKIRKFRKNFAKFCDFLQNFATFSKNQLDSFVDLENPEKLRIWLQNFVSIQPRTSLEKSDVPWPTACCRAQTSRPSSSCRTGRPGGRPR